MKLASFFIISVALHAVAFILPISFDRSRGEELTPVTILNLDDRSDGTAGVGGNNETKFRGTNQKSSAASGADQHPNPAPARSSEPTPQAPTFANSAETGAPIAMALSPAANFDGLHGTSFAAMGGQNDGSGGSGNSGNGAGFGGGGGLGRSGAQAAQVSYNYTPKPEYPEKARREGNEGRVLLRVLVDEEGKSKTIEVNSSSGNEALDQAAREVIKRWRFSPARYGDKPVESWVRIPIDFRLTDVND